jgi:hypothetical protein
MSANRTYVWNGNSNGFGGARGTISVPNTTDFYLEFTTSGFQAGSAFELGLATSSLVLGDQNNDVLNGATAASLVGGKITVHWDKIVQLNGIWIQQPNGGTYLRSDPNNPPGNRYLEGYLNVDSKQGTLGLACSPSRKLIWFRSSMTGLWNDRVDADPAAGTNGINYAAIKAGNLFPYVCNGSLTGSTCTINGGSAAFRWAIPSGFVALDSVGSGVSSPPPPPPPPQPGGQQGIVLNDPGPQIQGVTYTVNGSLSNYPSNPTPAGLDLTKDNGATWSSLSNSTNAQTTQTAFQFQQTSSVLGIHDYALRDHALPNTIISNYVHFNVAAAGTSPPPPPAVSPPPLSPPPPVSPPISPPPPPPLSPPPIAGSGPLTSIMGAYTYPNSSSAQGEVGFMQGDAGGHGLQEFIDVVHATPKFRTEFNNAMDPTGFDGGAWGIASAYQNFSILNGGKMVPCQSFKMTRGWNNQAGDYNDIINGVYDQQFVSGVGRYVTAGIPEVHFRPAYEFNGTFMQDRADSIGATGFIAAWRRMALKLKSVSGTRVKIVWCPSIMNWNLNNGDDLNIYWPGDDVVDIIGLDLYSHVWPNDNQNLPNWTSETSTTFNGTTNNASAWMANPINRRHWWNFPGGTQYNPLDSYPNAGSGWGVYQTVNMAKKHGKPICFPEWGAGDQDSPVVWTPYDDAEFIKYSYDTILYAQTQGVTTVYANYWNIMAGDVNSEVGSKVGNRQPNVAASLRKYFGDGVG